MTPTQKIKWAILDKVAGWEHGQGLAYPLANIDELYDDLVGRGEHWDAGEEVREGQVETKLPCEWSRHYETKSVGMKMPDGSWVGWTYYYGGGKHGEPGEVPWMEDAYDLECSEEEKMVVVQTFSKVGER